MVGYVVGGTKGRRSLLALLVAVAVAAVGFYLMSIATAAKPADAAAVSCNSFAYAPKIGFPDGVRKIYFKSTIECNGVIDSATIESNGHVWSGGKWVEVTGPYGHVGDFYNDSTSYTHTTVKTCRTPLPAAKDYHTQNYKPHVSYKGTYGALKELPTRYSSRFSLRCL